MHALKTLFSAFAFTNESHYVHQASTVVEAPTTLQVFLLRMRRKKAREHCRQKSRDIVLPSCVLSIRTVTAAMLYHHYSRIPPPSHNHHPTNDHHVHHVLKPRACHYFLPTIFDI